MPIEGVCQPEYLLIDDTLRLRRFDGEYAFALGWYQDAEMVRLVDGKAGLYDMEKLGRMYRYLDAHGELYFIEVFRDGSFVPVGDVTFWQEDCPIVIGEAGLRGKGIGRRVVAALIARGRQLGYDCLYVDEIYDFNAASQRMFEALGFEKYEKTEKGSRYRLRLEKRCSRPAGSNQTQQGEDDAIQCFDGAGFADRLWTGHGRGRDVSD